jgi:PHD/YefM family antitoxin component YafN of YafNO toxin-antitoxin module
VNVQIIEKNGKPEFVVLPFDEYQALIVMAEDKSDEAAVLPFRESDV